jgi:hypothetical protein
MQRYPSIEDGHHDHDKIRQAARNGRKRRNGRTSDHRVARNPGTGSMARAFEPIQPVKGCAGHRARDAKTLLLARKCTRARPCSRAPHPQAFANRSPPRKKHDSLVVARRSRYGACKFLFGVWKNKKSQWRNPITECAPCGITSEHFAHRALVVVRRKQARATYMAKQYECDKGDVRFSCCSSG